MSTVSGRSIDRRTRRPREAITDVKNPNFEQIVRTSFAAQQFMATLGAKIADVSPGEIEIRSPFRSDLIQKHGFLHAGAVTAILDSACGYAALTLMPQDVGVLTVEFKVNLLAPARGKELIARAKVVRAGDTITVCQAVATMLHNSAELPVATMLATIMTLRERADMIG